MVITTLGSHNRYNDFNIYNGYNSYKHLSKTFGIVMIVTTCMYNVSHHNAYNNYTGNGIHKSKIATMAITATTALWVIITMTARIATTVTIYFKSFNNYNDYNSYKNYKDYNGHKNYNSYNSYNSFLVAVTKNHDTSKNTYNLAPFPQPMAYFLLSSHYLHLYLNIFFLVGGQARLGQV